MTQQTQTQTQTHTYQRKNNERRKLERNFQCLEETGHRDTQRIAHVVERDEQHAEQYPLGALGCVCVYACEYVHAWTERACMQMCV